MFHVVRVEEDERREQAVVSPGGRPVGVDDPGSAADPGAVVRSGSPSPCSGHPEPTFDGDRPPDWSGVAADTRVGRAKYQGGYVKG